MKKESNVIKESSRDFFDIKEGDFRCNNCGQGDDREFTYSRTVANGEFFKDSPSHKAGGYNLMRLEMCLTEGEGAITEREFQSEIDKWNNDLCRNSKKS